MSGAVPAEAEQGEKVKRIPELARWTAEAMQNAYGVETDTVLFYDGSKEYIAVVGGGRSCGIPGVRRDLLTSAQRERVGLLKRPGGKSPDGEDLPAEKVETRFGLTRELFCTFVEQVPGFGADILDETWVHLSGEPVEGGFAPIVHIVDGQIEFTNVFAAQPAAANFVPVAVFPAES